MPRLLTLGCLLLPAAALAVDPPAPALYPTSSSGSLSQSLPSLVSGAAGTAPAPVMVSQPAWGAGYSVGCPTPTAGTMFAPTIPCPAPVCARQPLMVPRVHRLPVPMAGGCGSHGSLLDRLRAWLCGGAGPAVVDGFVFAPPVVPLRDWGWADTTIGGPGVATGWPSNCEARGGRLLPQFPLGRAFARSADPCPTTLCPTYPTVGPRPIQIPLATAYDRTATCARPRPNLIRRLLSFLSPGWFGCDDPCDYTVATSPYGYGAGYGTPAVGGYTAPAASAPMLVRGAPVAPPAPVPAPVAAAGGYHFAAPERRPVSVMPAAAVALPLTAPAVQPAAATQPARR